MTLSVKPRHGHIVDVLIEERAPTLTSHWAWPALRPAFYALLGYKKAVHLADTIKPMGGRDALDWVSDHLAIKLAVTGLENVPRAGRCVIIANHPTGIADGVALDDALKRLRSDACFFANSDAHRVCPDFGETLIPVEWVEEKRTRDRTRLTLKMAQEAFSAERPIVIFPAGRLARYVKGVLEDPEWMATAVSLARKNDAPVIPCHVSGPNSALFHFFDRFSNELRDITLFHELLNKKGQLFELAFGPVITPDALDGDAAAVTEAMKAHVSLAMATDPNAPFKGIALL